ncbi:MAG: hypothetical protein U9N42_00875 [Campylobacterota bacterium]|nr:hypothetical protein [Campylobacterota bacterium]
MDELIINNVCYSNIIPTKIGLNLDKGIFLIRAYEEDSKSKKKYLRNAIILADDEIITSTFSDTAHFMEELNLFDYGNDQNKYLNISEYKKTKSLKLKIDSHNIYISKSEAKTIYKLFNLSLMGYFLTRVLEYEYRFTPETLAKLLFDDDLQINLDKDHDEKEEEEEKIELKKKIK